MPKRICIVSSGQPSANPRLVKEAITFFQAGYIVTVVYCPISPWADEFDALLFQSHPGITWIRAGFHKRDEQIFYTIAKIRRKLYSVVSVMCGYKFNIAIRSLVLYSQELEKKSRKQKADLYIGHNLGAISSVVKAARLYKAKAAFDFEDFHGGETTYGSSKWKKITSIEHQYVPSLCYATAASPLIATSYQQCFAALPLILVNNCFEMKYAAKELSLLPNAPLKLFWFSQFIGPDRGLETVIEAIGKTRRQNVLLTLLGNCSTSSKNNLIDLAYRNNVSTNQLCFLGPVSSEQVFSIARDHHIGIASEPGRDTNNNIALSNKIFTYLLSGNAILFSATDAQKLFFSENPGIGFLYQPGNADELAGFLMRYLDDPEIILQHRLASLKLGKERHNWDREKKKLLSIVQQQFEA